MLNHENAFEIFVCEIAVIFPEQNCVSILYSDPYSTEVSTLRFDQPLGNIGLGNG